jgi:hypothetical protein
MGIFAPALTERRQIRERRTLRFVHEASNVILMGPLGVGKTHLAVAIAKTAIQSGQAAYFMTAHDLVKDLGRVPGRTAQPPLAHLLGAESPHHRRDERSSTASCIIRLR